MSLIALLAGMGAGYMNQKQKNKDSDRQDKLDKQQEDLHNAKIAEINQDKADRTAMKFAGETVTACLPEHP